MIRKRKHGAPHPLIYDFVKARHRRGISQQAVSEGIGRSRDTVTRWETGSSDPGLTGFIAAVEALGCKVVIIDPEEPQP